jgi:hypothetical protein
MTMISFKKSTALIGFCSIALASAAVLQGNITAQELNQDAASYMGKQVTLTGRVDRVLGNGSYIVSDGKMPKDPSHRITTSRRCRADFERRGFDQVEWQGRRFQSE